MDPSLAHLCNVLADAVPWLVFVLALFAAGSAR